ncbi:hypothetical protein MMPV_006869 [Pyropia vietnamensis]
MDNAETRCDQVGVSAATPEAATVAVTSPGGDLPDVGLVGRTRPTESTFVTALDGTTGHPVSTGVMGATSHPPPSPEDSVLASIARIEARFSGLCERQERTEDAMAVLMSARHTSGTQRVPPTPVHFGGIGPGSLFPSGDPAVIHNRRNRRNEGLESDSSEELERSHAERHTRSTASGQREQQPGGFSRYVASTGGDGGGPSLPSQEGSVPSLPEVGPGTIPATLLQALTTQITVRIMEKMESDEFAHQLARRLGNQDAGEDIVNEVFRSVLTPERYRLDDRSPVVTDVMRNTSHRAIRSMQTLMKGVPMFGNPNGRPLAVIGFLSSFKAAADKALVNEGLAVEILPFFVDERVRGILRQTAPMPGMRCVAFGLPAPHGPTPRGPTPYREGAGRGDNEASDQDPIPAQVAHRGTGSASTALLAPIQCSDDRFAAVLSYETYRLRNKKAKYGSAEARKMGRKTRDMKHSFAGYPPFRGKEPLRIFAWLRKFVKACNDNDVTEGMALYAAPHFMTGDAEVRYTRVLPDSAGTASGAKVDSYPEAVNWLLLTYAEPHTLALAQDTFSRAIKEPDEPVEAFASRLRALSELCGNIHSEGTMKQQLIQGPPEYVRTDAFVFNTPSATYQQLATYTAGKVKAAQDMARLGQPSSSRGAYPLGKGPRHALRL